MSNFLDFQLIDSKEVKEQLKRESGISKNSLCYWQRRFRNYKRRYSALPKRIEQRLRLFTLFEY
jgi:hypothetical protein